MENLKTREHFGDLDNTKNIIQKGGKEVLVELFWFRIGTNEFFFVKTEINLLVLLNAG
jgi:hypothetical protein